MHGLPHSITTCVQRCPPHLDYQSCMTCVFLHWHLSGKIISYLYYTPSSRQPIFIDLTTYKHRKSSPAFGPNLQLKLEILQNFIINLQRNVIDRSALTSKELFAKINANTSYTLPLSTKEETTFSR